MARRRLQLGVVALALAVAAPSAAEGRTYHGYVTSSGTITLQNAAGGRVSRIPRGIHTFRIHDTTSAHNFALRRGSTVLRRTSVVGTATVSWSVRIRDGVRYRYECTPHRTSMYGRFRGFRP